MPHKPLQLPQPSRSSAKDDLVRVALDTDLGRIVLALDRGRAPITTANFLAYVDKHGSTARPFYRAMHYGDGGLIQGGIRDGSKQLPPIAIETDRDDRPAQCRRRDRHGQWRTGHDAHRFLHPDHRHPGVRRDRDRAGYAAFGHVVEGMDVVKAIFAAPRSPTKGDGMMKGQMLEPEVKIVKAARLPD